MSQNQTNYLSTRLLSQSQTVASKTKSKVIAWLFWHSIKNHFITGLLVNNSECRKVFAVLHSFASPFLHSIRSKSSLDSSRFGSAVICVNQGSRDQKRLEIESKVKPKSVTRSHTFSCALNPRFARVFPRFAHVFPRFEHVSPRFEPALRTRFPALCVGYM